MSLLLSLTLSSALAAPPSGTFTLSSSTAELEREKVAAIERSVEPMNFAFAAIAEPRLEKLVSWCGQYEVSSSDGAFRVRCDQKDAFVVPRDGRRGSYVSKEGVPHPVDYRDLADGVELEFHGEEGSQVTRYRLVGEDTLVVTKELRSEFLETPLSWTMRYRLAGEAPAAPAKAP